MQSLGWHLQFYAPGAVIRDLMDFLGELEIAFVVGNFRSPPSFLTPEVFDATVQSAGAVTSSATVPLMSGWSKHANTRCASLLSKWLCR